MADKQIAFTAVSDHWYWRGSSRQDCQTGTLVVLPEQALITSVEFHIAGLDYNDPVYGYQNESGYARAAIWRESDGVVLTKSAYQSLPPSAGGTQPYVSFDLDNVLLPAGERIIVGFWRRSSSTGTSTQWDYCETASAVGYTTYAHDIYDSDTGPETFKITDTYVDRSLNFKLHYTNGGRVNVWDGHTWRPKNGFVWNGTAWTKATAYVWNGTAWTEAVED